MFIISSAVLFCYFFSEAILRQFILHRAGVQSISLNSILAELPAEIRDEAIRKITIAEYKDELKLAKTVSKKISISIALATLLSPEKLQEAYAEIIDKYPNAPEARAAFTNFLMAPAGALKSISIARYHQFIKLLNKQQRFYAWSSGFSKLKGLKVSPPKKMEFLLPLLDFKPDGREYQQLYLKFSELAFQEANHSVELKANKLKERCEKLPYFDEYLEKKAKTEARKKKRSKPSKRKK
jgi:hypothetical protein